jgi:hypothetical protein
MTFMSINPYDTPAAEVDDAPSSHPRSAFFLVRCWRGEARLWQAFWLTLVLGYVLLNVLSIAALATMASLMNTSGLIVFATTLLLNVSFLVFALISVWRCAPNTDYAPMNAAARVVVMLILAVIAVQFVNGLLKGKRMIEQRRQQQSLQQQPPAYAGNLLVSSPAPAMRRL